MPPLLIMPLSHDKNTKNTKLKKDYTHCCLVGTAAQCLPIPGLP
nr:hypothetical protein WMHIBSEC_WMHIBSEC_CDS_0018 [Caudoviricetes sp.]CAI9751688.1 hypothetical protein AZFZUZMX_AZFZUZMX_CDS_0018 [Caudoviricetes sp.]